jgi:uncharacterized protein (DUF169 family)
MGRAKAIVTAPLHKADYMRMSSLFTVIRDRQWRLIQGALYHEGGTMIPSLWVRAACGAELVVPIMTGKWQYYYSRRRRKGIAMPGDDEMVFAMPLSKAEELIVGLEETHKAGAARLPRPTSV